MTTAPESANLTAARLTLVRATERLEQAPNQAAHRLALADFNAAFERMELLKSERPTTRIIRF